MKLMVKPGNRPSIFRCDPLYPGPVLLRGPSPLWDGYLGWLTFSADGSEQMDSIPPHPDETALSLGSYTGDYFNRSEVNHAGERWLLYYSIYGDAVPPTVSAAYSSKIIVHDSGPDGVEFIYTDNSFIPPARARATIIGKYTSLEKTFLVTFTDGAGVRDLIPDGAGGYYALDTTSNHIGHWDGDTEHGWVFGTDDQTHKIEGKDLQDLGQFSPHGVKPIWPGMDPHDIATDEFYGRYWWGSPACLFGLGGAVFALAEGFYGYAFFGVYAGPKTTAIWSCTGDPTVAANWDTSLEIFSPFNIDNNNSNFATRYDGRFNDNMLIQNPFEFGGVVYIPLDHRYCMSGDNYDFFAGGDDPVTMPFTALISFDGTTPTKVVEWPKLTTGTDVAWYGPGTLVVCGGNLYFCWASAHGTTDEVAMTITLHMCDAVSGAELSTYSDAISSTTGGSHPMLTDSDGINADPGIPFGMIGVDDNILMAYAHTAAGIATIVILVYNTTSSTWSRYDHLQTSRVHGDPARCTYDTGYTDRRLYYIG